MKSKLALFVGPQLEAERRGHAFRHFIFDRKRIGYRRVHGGRLDDFAALGVSQRVPHPDQIS